MPGLLDDDEDDAFSAKCVSYSQCLSSATKIAILIFSFGHVRNFLGQYYSRQNNIFVASPNSILCTADHTGTPKQRDEIVETPLLFQPLCSHCIASSI